MATKPEDLPWIHERDFSNMLLEGQIEREVAKRTPKPQPPEPTRLEDHEMSVDQLAERYGDAEHPVYPLEGWQYEVMNNDTRAGYWQWVLDRVCCFD